MARDTEPAVRGRARRYAAEEPEPERRSEERPGYGRGEWGSEEQTGWRGPGEGPGYQQARQRPQTFQQSSAGGQIPGELRYWRSGQRPELRATEPERGPHFGRGPKNYRRSDDRIREELCDRLMAHPEIDASEIEVEVKDAHVVLRGTVPDRRTKHRAEDLADRVLGALDVDNQLRVQRGEEPAREQH